MDLKASKIDKVAVMNMLQSGKTHIQMLRERLETEKAENKEHKGLRDELDECKRNLHETEVNLLYFEDENEMMLKGEKDLRRKIERLLIENECLKADSKLSDAAIRHTNRQGNRDQSFVSQVAESK